LKEDEKSLKNLIHKQFNIHPDEQILTFRTKHITEGKLQDNKITSGSVIQLGSRGYGGF
jgi:hypothetical protein